MDEAERSPKRRKTNDSEFYDSDRRYSRELKLENQAAHAVCQAEEARKEALTASNDTVSSPPKESEDHGKEPEEEALGDNDSSRTDNIELAPLPQPPLSKSQQKKLRRKQEWEAGRENRKAYKKEKRKEKQARKRAAREEEYKETLQDATNGQAYQADGKSQEQDRSKRYRPVQLPVTFIFDCDFDDLMFDKERISLCSQLTRSYSDNFKAKYRYHLAIASFGGHIKERFDTVLLKHYLSWKGVRIFDEDFVNVVAKSEAWLSEKQAGHLAAAFEKTSQPAEDANKDDRGGASVPEKGEIIYLTSDSPDTLAELKPYSTYIIGGLVDRNRHKGICYKRACDRGIKTAKLPIGEYMEMTSRFVLATNHVAEIMLRWLEYRDWGKAFLEVMPKRKGGVLKETGKRAENEGEGDDGAAAVGSEEAGGAEDGEDGVEEKGSEADAVGEEGDGDERNEGKDGGGDGDEADDGNVDEKIEGAIGMIVGEIVGNEGP